MAKFLKAILFESSLLMPHVSTDLNAIDFNALKRAGVRAVVFDKDNTLTFPDAPTLDDSIKASLETCKSVFGDKVAVLSNSVGSRRDPKPTCRLTHSSKKAVSLSFDTRGRNPLMDSTRQQRFSDARAPRW
eukprot:EC123455.1.p1 GENE.EC123455.1~~EC123455.1.p1  ORF type:complete len:131 (+),score=18.85 EC123455.1:125-517(+)